MDAPTDTTDKETNERTDGWTDGRRDTSLCPLSVMGVNLLVDEA